MRITIEIGTEVQRQLIRRELSILESAAHGAQLVDQISRVVVPADFE